VSKSNDKLAAELTDMAKAAGLADMSPSELKAYTAAIEDRFLESGNPLLMKTALAVRRAKERARAGDRRPFGKLIAEEADRLDAASSDSKTPKPDLGSGPRR
jgi:hypothetical protein